MFSLPIRRPEPAPLPIRGMLQRKCACGTHTPGGGACASCAGKGSRGALTVGPANDPLEQEADRVAEQVSTRTPAGLGKAPLGIQRFAARPSTGPEAPASVARTLAGPGRPLEPGIRTDMERRFGHDFSRVRVHDGDAAAHSAGDVDARAYTVGNHIVFGAGQFAPAKAEGRRLLAHELTHTIQQGAAAGASAGVVRRVPIDGMGGRGLDGGAVPGRGGGPVPDRGGGPLPFREATELTECIRIMGDVDYCRHEVLGEPIPQPSVGSIDIVSSAAGATGGFAAVTSGDLNSPGPWNNAATGGVSNVHQIHFNLDRGNSGLLKARREIQRSAWIAGVEHRNPADQPPPPGAAGPTAPGGFNGVLVGPDGPGDHEVKWPTTRKIVVADAPGAARLTAAQFPFRYSSHFRVTVFSGAKDVARIAYDVQIEKTDAANIPNVTNSITSVSKQDLVYGRAL